MSAKKEGIHSAPIVVFGEALIDAFPDASVVGGAPFNVARTLSRFDFSPLVISRIGQDAAADLVLGEMRAFDLDRSGLQTDRVHSTGMVKVEMTTSGHRFVIMPDQAYDYIDQAAATEAIDAAFQGQAPGLIYFGSLAQRQDTARRCLHALLEGSSATKYLDLNLRDGQYTLETISASLKYADIVKVNDDELQILLQEFMPRYGALRIDLNDDKSRERITAALSDLVELFALQAVIVTLGERGYAYFDNVGRLLGNCKQTGAIAVVDTVGCGDAFSAVFLVGLQRAWPTELALERAHAFAGAICTIRGAVNPDKRFYREWLQQWDQADGTS